MAGSRLEKIGTIYSRVTGLMQSKALNWEDRPLWYDVYSAFPPKDEPRFDRPVPNTKLKQIFYAEDKIRAIFHRNNKQIGTVVLQGKSETITQRFIDTFKKVQAQYKDQEVTDEQLYKESIDILNRERGIVKEPIKSKSEAEEESVSLSLAFKEAQKKQETGGISIKDIFKD